MEQKLWKLIGFGALVLILIICTLVVIHWAVSFFDWAALDKGDLPTWVGATGTVGTLAGTLWIVNAAYRKEVTQARLHAAGFMLRLVNARGAIERVCRSLHIDAQKDRGEASITICVFDLDKIKLWTATDLMPMAPLSSRKVGQLAEAGDQIATAIRALEMVREGDDSLDTPEKRKEFAIRLHFLLSGTSRLLEDGIDLCDHARRALHMNSG
ncbi:hypothetical protein [Massilia sp. HP4]|uniref:hypothetical protein n=1 Tax=Massilia sp. HP4 TaxID=2562316 RepID=UPI0010C09BC1|nr:hypothetical protein [Massilia sp. HP4]